MRVALVGLMLAGCTSGTSPELNVSPAEAGSTDTASAAVDSEVFVDAAIDDSAPETSPSDLDPDGVKMLQPSKKGGEWWRLSKDDPNSAPDFEIENGTKATKQSQSGLSYWNVLSHALSYASGGTGWTTRFHIYQSHTKTQKFTWKTQSGFLATPADLRDQELTIYLRGHGVLDAPRLAFTLKIRGGYHTDKNADQGSCTMMVFGGKDSSGVTRFGKELIHPQYDYVKLVPAVTGTALSDDVWYGLKLVSYQLDAKQIRYQMWIDLDPWNFATGAPKNNWQKMSEYVDVAGKSSGMYTLLADWGGLITTVRTDGWHDIDFALYSIREIAP